MLLLYLYFLSLCPRGQNLGSSAYTAKPSQSQCWLMIFDEFYHLCLLLWTHLMGDGTAVTSLPVQTAADAKR